MTYYWNLIWLLFCLSASIAGLYYFFKGFNTLKLAHKTNPYTEERRQTTDFLLGGFVTGVTEVTEEHFVVTLYPPRSFSEVFHRKGM